MDYLPFNLTIPKADEVMTMAGTMDSNRLRMELFIVQATT